MISFHIPLLLFSLLLSVDLCFSHSEGSRHGGHSHYQPKRDGGAQNVLKDKQYLRDYEHIKEDVQELYNKDFADQLDDAEMEIFYFQLHDLDNDKQLDGLELLAAMNHVMNRENEIPTEELAKAPEVRQSLQNWWNDKFEEDAQFIDEILKEEDVDHDGYLNFFEFALFRHR